MTKITVKYLAHMSAAAGNTIKEELNTEAKTVRELVAWVEQRNPGFGALMIDPQTNQMVHNNSVLLRRAGGLTNKLFDLDTTIEEGDTITFW